MQKNEVLIIESRSPDDIYEDRYEGGTLKQVLKLQRTNAKLVEVVDKNFLVKALRLAESEHIKYVHISAHGSQEGFVLTDGDFITWKDFDSLAWPYLKGCCLCFSSCDVGNGAEAIFKYHKSFCNAVIAPTRMITWGEGLVAFSVFYHRAMFPDKSTAQDVKIINSIIGAGSFRYIQSPYKSVTFTIGA
ncbi:hypothetical protein LH452_15170 [Laribacter hongkongensis]|uniref:hypothetical protein n=1 Tax=Laribacter hongkongensis TaxID=168471 RepID=UPI001EFD6992|nr:hypothetical protein [Laribacter hongkongensis]MCG9060222.1 hypothetical protein [Laribacter hongkongensis]MCG9084402.1 hypothetical protein [Laribacter hongkongensis]MCG9087319.1 hypothetical protein [Laribacter hongkongensis]